MDMTEPEGISGHQTQPLHFAQKGKQVQFREVPKVTRGTSSSSGPLAGVRCSLATMPYHLLGIGNANTIEWTTRAM